jgi:hypothetical protein
MKLSGAIHSLGTEEHEAERGKESHQIHQFKV